MPFHLYQREMNQRLILEAIDRFRISKRSKKKKALSFNIFIYMQMVSDTRDIG